MSRTPGLTGRSVVWANWEVVWLGKQGLVRKDVGHDFGEGLRIYALLKSSGRKLVTLRCKNVGFPPPESVTQHQRVEWQRVRVMRGGRYVTRKKKTVTTVNRMSELNDKGIWWCPYCIKFLPFKLKEDWTGRQHMMCPICGITERDFHVHIYNPTAIVVQYARRTRGRRSRRR